MIKTLFTVTWTHNGKKISKEYDNLSDANQAYQWLKQNGGEPDNIKVRVDRQNTKER